MSLFANLSLEISQGASAAIESPQGRPFENYVTNCADKHWEHVPYSLTLSSLDRIKACRVSLFQQTLPRLTSLVIKGKVDLNAFNYVINTVQSLKDVTILNAVDFPSSKIERPTRLMAISIVHPVKP